MKNDREFVDSVYEKYGREKAKERDREREAARRRKFRYIGTLAACIILAVGILGVTQLNNRGGSDLITVPESNDQELSTANNEVQDTDVQGETDDTKNAEDNTNERYEPSDPEPYMTDQGLVNEVVGKAGSIKGIELSKSSGNTISSQFFTDPADISNVVEWVKANSDSVMSEATFYANFDSSNMPETYFVMSAQFSADPADSIDVYVVTDSAPGFN